MSGENMEQFMPGDSTALAGALCVVEHQQPPQSAGNLLH